MRIQLTTLALVAAMTTACNRPASPVESPVAAYHPKTGKLTTLSADANRNGRIETVSYMDGARISRIEVDLDEDGKVDRWDFYVADGRLEKVGLSRLNDGVMDALAFYEGETLVRMQVSSNRDGRFDRTEFYRQGVLSHSADDTNGDGRPDKWDEYQASASGADYAVKSTAFDDSGSGRPERRFVYGAGGSIERVEIDPDGDGRFVPAAR